MREVSIGECLDQYQLTDVLGAQWNGVHLQGH